MVGSPKLLIRRTFSATFELPKGEGKPKPQSKLYRNPVVLAQEWQRLISRGEVGSRADLARQLGVSRAHVTQVPRLVDLAPQVKERVLSLGAPTEGLILGAHTLRSIARLPAEEQERRVLGMIKQDAW